METGDRAAGLLVALLTWLVLVAWNPVEPVNSATHDHGGFVSDSHRFTVRADTGAQLQRIGEAVTSFSDTGLDLPPLEIIFHEDFDGCSGARGRFKPGTTPWQIAICDEHLSFIVDHELAHAWERAHVGDHQRQAFLDLLGLENWHDLSDPWNARGAEWAAVVIQKGISGLPLPPALSDMTIARLKGYEVLTGQVDPRLVDWGVARGVRCSEGPTPLSRPLTDALGEACE